MKKLILACALLMPSLALAEASWHRNHHNEEHVIIIEQPAPTTTVTTTATPVVNNYTTTYENNFNDNRLYGGMVAFGAISAVPTYNHVKADHGNSGIGIGAAFVNGYSGFAIVGEHHFEDIDQLSLRAAIATSDVPEADEVYSLGGMWGF